MHYANVQQLLSVYISRLVWACSPIAVRANLQLYLRFSGHPITVLSSKKNKSETTLSEMVEPTIKTDRITTKATEEDRLWTMALIITIRIMTVSSTRRPWSSCATTMSTSQTTRVRSATITTMMQRRHSILRSQQMRHKEDMHRNPRISTMQSSRSWIQHHSNLLSLAKSAVDRRRSSLMRMTSLESRPPSERRRSLLTASTTTVNFMPRECARIAIIRQEERSQLLAVPIKWCMPATSVKTATWRTMERRNVWRTRLPRRPRKQSQKSLLPSPLRAPRRTLTRCTVSNLLRFRIRQSGSGHCLPGPLNAEIVW